MRKIVFQAFLIVILEAVYIYLSFSLSQSFLPTMFPYPNHIGDGLTALSYLGTLAFLCTLIYCREVSFNPRQLVLFITFYLLFLYHIFFYQPNFLLQHFPQFLPLFLLNYLGSFIFMIFVFLILIIYATVKPEIKQVFTDGGMIVVANIIIGIIVGIVCIILFSLIIHSKPPINLLFPSFGEGTAASLYFSSVLYSAYVVSELNNQSLIVKHNEIPKYRYHSSWMTRRSVGFLMIKLLVSLITLIAAFAPAGIVISDTFLFVSYSVPKSFIYFVFLQILPASLFFSSKYTPLGLQHQ
ncbi:MAG: hypothetical protein INQ03_00800 [Candidatus Heimdallarchaeota archaeon]|nr:hypothetical protein [Candidatus Heimdallarchaeota archaeon]